jgi:tetratricopeptide (TPR) repeat protein
MTIRLILLWLLVVFLFMASAAVSDERSCDELIAESEKLWLEDQLEESDKKLDRAVELCPEKAQIYWRKARNIYDGLEDIPRDQKPEKKILIKKYREVEALADKCTELDENDAQCWLWKGVGIGRRGTTQGVLKSLFMASDVENAWLKAESLGLTYRSEDGTSNAKCGMKYALGMFYRVVPEWLCHFPLKQIVGTCGDLKKSVEYQRKAIACLPNAIDINKELAVSLLCHGQQYDQPEEIEEAKKLLISLQSLPEIRPFDKIDKEHAKMLLADISLACGYQRDKQQEQSKEVYDNQ